MGWKNITKDQAETFEILMNMFLKATFSIVVIVILILTFCKLTKAKEWSETVPLATLEAILTNTVYRAFKHYFPVKKEE